MKKLARLIPLLFFAACFIAALIFAGDNSQSVALRFLDNELVALPFALWLVLGFAAGAILVLLLLTPVLGVQKAQLRRLRKKLKGVPSEADLKNE